MEIGTGIFLGLLFIGVVTLYIFTRDRWNWRKIILRPAIWLVSLICVISFGMWGKTIFDNRVTAVTEFMGVKLTDTQADIKFKKGKAADESGGAWGFKDSEGNYETSVLFRESRVRAVQYLGTCTYCNNVFGLGVGTTYERLVEKLGEPSHVDTSDDALMRITSFEKWNLVFHLAEGKVIGYGIFDKAAGPLKFAKQPITKPAPPNN